MLHLFNEAGFSIAIAHCNFQLRGKESDGDELFVQEVCKKLNLPVYTKRFETEGFAWEQGISIQMAARNLRYAWFDDLLQMYACSHLATGHHFDDSMETILLNLTKGTSTEGLAGIPVRNGNTIRPLLFATRAQIEKYAKENGIVWREDQSNLTDDYQRNFIRHQVIPKLKELNPSLETTAQTSIEKIQGDLELMHHAFESWKKKYVTQAVNRIVIDKKAFDEYHGGAAVLWRYIRLHSFNFEQAREIVHVLKGQSGKHFLSPTHLLVVDRQTIIISPNIREWSAVSIEKGQQEFGLGPWKLYLSNGATLTPGTNKMEAALDAELIQFPLVWRKWKHGDFFQPLGMNHKKKLSDFLIDNKISLVDKNNITVLESAGQIVYVVGWRIDDRYKITDHTKHVLNLKVEQA